MIEKFNQSNLIRSCDKFMWKTLTWLMDIALARERKREREDKSSPSIFLRRDVDQESSFFETPDTEKGWRVVGWEKRRRRRTATFDRVSSRIAASSSRKASKRCILQCFHACSRPWPGLCNRNSSLLHHFPFAKFPLQIVDLPPIRWMEIRRDYMFPYSRMMDDREMEKRRRRKEELFE